jgi:hypothetical protein
VPPLNRALGSVSAATLRKENNGVKMMEVIMVTLLVAGSSTNT